MNDYPDFKSIALWLLTIVMAIFGYLGKRLHERVDNSVSRAELEKTLGEMRDDRLRMHNENREELRYIRDRVDDISDRQE